MKIIYHIKYVSAKEDRLTWNITKVNPNHINNLLEHAYHTLGKIFILNSAVFLSQIEVQHFSESTLSVPLTLWLNYVSAWKVCETVHFGSFICPTSLKAQRIKIWGQIQRTYYNNLTGMFSFSNLPLTRKNYR